MTRACATPIGGFDKAPFTAEYRTMEIHQLRYFVAVAEEGSFSNAAEREHVSRPSLSQQI
jgi:Bacterial regulatory helix-turn-helix protein, lysR family